MAAAGLGGTPPRRPPPGGLLAGASREEVLGVVACGDLAAAVGALPTLPLARPGSACGRLLALHDRAAGGRRCAFGQPALRLAEGAPLGARAVATQRWREGRDGGEGVAFWLAFAGRFWAPWTPLAAPDLDAFAAWRVPRTSRVAWCISLRRQAAAGDRLVCALTMRADHQDRAARLAFAAYMTVAGPASRALRRRLLVGLASGAGLRVVGGVGSRLAAGAQMAPF